MKKLAIIIPTLNERENIQPLIRKIEILLTDIDWEIIFVDDNSVDGTLEELVLIADRNHRVRFIERIGRVGLSSACIEGFLATSADFIAVMDADHQHDENLLPLMLKEIQSKPDLDIVIGSRFLEGGDVGDWSKSRLVLSNTGKTFSQLVLPIDISDPMSGYFMTRRTFVWSLAPKLSGRGFKILIDILVTAGKSVRIAELPYHFREREKGQSKLTTAVAIEFIALLIEKSFGRILPFRFICFISVGTVGMVTHLAVLASMMTTSAVFWKSQMIAAISAMTINFFLNNLFTYQDRQIAGFSLIRGLILFYALCSGGFLINMAIATHLYQIGSTWWLAGLAGGAVGAVWNYATNTSITWRDV